jgi:hypothetical protein
MHSICLGISSALFIYYTLLAVLLLSIYLLQIVDVSGSLTTDLATEVLGTVDVTLVMWFRVGFMRTTSLSIFFGLLILTQLKARFQGGGA